jgi:hypothetical protein
MSPSPFEAPVKLHSVSNYACRGARNSVLMFGSIAELDHSIRRLFFIHMFTGHGQWLTSRFRRRQPMYQKLTSLLSESMDRVERTGAYPTECVISRPLSAFSYTDFMVVVRSTSIAVGLSVAFLFAARVFGMLRNVPSSSSTSSSVSSSSLVSIVSSSSPVSVVCRYGELEWGRWRPDRVAQ